LRVVAFRTLRSAAIRLLAPALLSFASGVRTSFVAAAGLTVTAVIIFVSGPSLLDLVLALAVWTGAFTIAASGVRVMTLQKRLETALEVAESAQLALQTYLGQRNRERAEAERARLADDLDTPPSDVAPARVHLVSGVGRASGHAREDR
jgi:hypothetical protein